MDIVPYTWDEFHSAFEAAFMLASSVPGRVDFIAVTSPDIRTPDSNFLPKLQNVAAAMPPNAGMFVLAGGSDFGRMMVSIVARVTGWAKRVAIVDTLDEARTLIAERRSAAEPHRT
jgi:hypothetical protein